MFRYLKNRLNYCLLFTGDVGDLATAGNPTHHFRPCISPPLTSVRVYHHHPSLPSVYITTIPHFRPCISPPPSLPSVCITTSPHFRPCISQLPLTSVHVSPYTLLPSVCITPHFRPCISPPPLTSVRVYHHRPSLPSVYITTTPHFCPYRF